MTFGTSYSTVEGGPGLQKIFWVKLLEWSLGYLLSGFGCLERLLELYSKSNRQNDRNFNFLRLFMGVSSRFGGWAWAPGKIFR